MSENLVIVSWAEQARQRYRLKAGHQCQAIKTPSIVSGGDLAWVVFMRRGDLCVSLSTYLDLNLFPIFNHIKSTE